MIETLAQANSLRPLAPLWIVGPIAILTMLLLAGHVHLTARICEPESRRRIRMATGMLGLTIVPIATFSLSIVTPANQRLFAVSWMLIAGLVVIALLLAFLDMFNTLHIYIDARRELRRTTRDSLTQRDSLTKRDEDAAMRAAQHGSGDSPKPNALGPNAPGSARPNSDAPTSSPEPPPESSSGSRSETKP